MSHSPGVDEPDAEDALERTQRKHAGIEFRAAGIAADLSNANNASINS